MAKLSVVDYLLPGQANAIPARQLANMMGIRSTRYLRAAPHNGARRFGERFWHKRKYEKCGNTGCISYFSYCTIGTKDPPKPAVPIVRCCLRLLVESERRNGAVILSSVDDLHNGYYLPANNEEVDRYIAQQGKRVKTTLDCLRSAKRYRRLHQPGQMYIVDCVTEVDNGKDQKGDVV